MPRAPQAGLDHIVIAAETLDAGSDWVAQRLGIAPEAGGRHDFMGTHNRLLSLGPAEYLEIIATDPNAPAPPQPRWFGLDRFAGPPRLVAWVARSDRIAAPAGSRIMQAARGALRWRITVPDSGQMAADGLSPMLIDWGDGAHPCHSLPDHGLRLRALRLSHPDPLDLPTDDPRITCATGERGIAAVIGTPHGEVVL